MWKPGVSGNPRGKPAVLGAARKLLRAGKGDAAATLLREELEHGRTDYRSLMAARELLRLAAGAPLRRRPRWYPPGHRKRSGAQTA